MNGIASFSLYGSNPIYTKGAIENAKLMPYIYPGWMIKVYHGVEIDQNVIALLNSLGCETQVMTHHYGHPITPYDGKLSTFGKFWRFQTIADTRCKYSVFRDCDSRINIRETAAVRAWVESGTILHTMKDHRNQDRFPILAGMWGIINGSVDIMSLLANWKYDGDWFDDQTFLSQTVWPATQHSTIRHGRFGVPFPPHAPYDGFVGQRWTHDNKPLFE